MLSKEQLSVDRAVQSIAKSLRNLSGDSGVPTLRAPPIETRRLQTGGSHVFQTRVSICFVLGRKNQALLWILREETAVSSHPLALPGKPAGACRLQSCPGSHRSTGRLNIQQPPRLQETQPAPAQPRRGRPLRCFTPLRSMFQGRPPRWGVRHVAAALLQEAPRRLRRCCRSRLLVVVMYYRLQALRGEGGSMHLLRHPVRRLRLP